MTALKALAILEAAVLECKKRNINTLEVRDALNFLEPHTQPPWLILQYRNALDSDWTTDVGREGQQQVLCATFPRHSLISERTTRKANRCAGATVRRVSGHEGWRNRANGYGIWKAR